MCHIIWPHICTSYCIWLTQDAVNSPLFNSYSNRNLQEDFCSSDIFLDVLKLLAGWPFSITSIMHCSRSKMNASPDNIFLPHKAYVCAGRNTPGKFHINYTSIFAAMRPYFHISTHTMLSLPCWMRYPAWMNIHRKEFGRADCQEEAFAFCNAAPVHSQLQVTLSKLLRQVGKTPHWHGSPWFTQQGW